LSRIQAASIRLDSEVGRDVGKEKWHEKLLYCSFCGKSQHEVKKLIAGPSVFICDECIELCNDIIRDEIAGEQGAKGAKGELPTPEGNLRRSSTSM
jgi:hypothetical protein